MKSVKLTGIRQMQVMDVPDPVVSNPDDVLLRLSVVGVCGSDVHYFTNGRIGSQVVQYPFTVGHECSAVVEKTGPGVSSVKPGDRIAVEPSAPCRKCDQCLAGRPHTCRNLKFLGCPGFGEGCLSEFMIMPEESCFRIPDSMSMDQAALSEPLTIGYYAVQLSGLSGNASVGVLGAGPIGLSVLLCAKAAGASLELVTDPLDYRLSAAASLGVNAALNPEKQDVVRTVADSGLELDFVFECCGEQEALDQAVELLKPGGTLMLVGIPEQDRVSFMIDKLRRKEIRIQNVRRQCECLSKTLGLMSEGKIDPSFMITHRFGLEQTAEAFELVSGYRDGVIKAVIMPGEL